MTTDAEARTILDRVVPKVTGRTDLLVRSVDLIQGVARLETHYGDWWKPCGAAGLASNNWGAVHAKGAKQWATQAEAQCGPSSFVCTDGDGKGGKYWTCFQSYATPDDGAAHTVSVLWGNKWTRAYLIGGGDNPAEFASAMKKGGYFEAPIGTYQKAMIRNVGELRASLGRKRSLIGPAIATGVAGATFLFLGWRFSR